MSIFGKKSEPQQQSPQTSQSLDVKQIEAALNQVVANMKKTYDGINGRLDKMQSEIEQSFTDVGTDFESLSKDVQMLKSVVGEGMKEEELEVPKPKMYKRVTNNEVKDFESEREKKLRKK